MERLVAYAKTLVVHLLLCLFARILPPRGQVRSRFGQP